MKKIILFLILICIDFIVNAQQSKIPSDVKENIQKRVEYGDNVSIVVGLINGDQVNYFNYGKTALKNGTDVDENSVFEIGSISKTFTTIALADEIVKGTMKLSDPISKYLPKHVKVPTKNEKVITLKDLATHTSGLPRMPSNFRPSNPENPFADYSVQQMYDFLNTYELTRNIGEQYEYSNYGMGLLGHILELHTGLTYDKLIKTKIANVLSMNSTGMIINGDMKNRLAKGHTGNREMPNWSFSTLGGAGGIKSTLSDMVKYMQANMTNNNNPIHKAMQLSHQMAYQNKAKDFEIGLGWHYDKTANGKRIIWHNGQTYGYHSFAGFIEGTGQGIVVLSNSTDNIDDIGLKLLDANRKIRVPNKQINVPETLLKSYIGIYELGPSIEIDVTKEDKQMYVQLTGQQKFPIYASSQNEFYLKVVEASVTFNKNENGETESITMHQNGQNQTAKKTSKKVEVLKEVKVSEAIIKTYVGIYEFNPSLHMTITNEGQQLFLQLTGQQKFPAFASSEIDFFLKVVKASITFNKDANGKIESLTLHQGGVDQTAKRLE